MALYGISHFRWSWYQNVRKNIYKKCTVRDFYFRFKKSLFYVKNSKFLAFLALFVVFFKIFIQRSKIANRTFFMYDLTSILTPRSWKMAYAIKRHVRLKFTVLTCRVFLWDKVANCWHQRLSLSGAVAKPPASAPQWSRVRLLASAKCFCSKKFFRFFKLNPKLPDLTGACSKCTNLCL